MSKNAISSISQLNQSKQEHEYEPEQDTASLNQS